MPAASALSKKILVSNRTALLSKYGTAGVKRIEQQVRGLATADAKRGFATRLVYLDARGVTPRVRDASDPKENKGAIDGVVKAHRPEYLVILGSHDVVPFQPIRNPLYDPLDPEGDPDEFALSDLPYACEARYERKLERFLGPTRVVGRIPDLTGGSDPKYLVGLLDHAARAKPTAPPGDAFALSVKLWEKSTRMSIRTLLGDTPTVLTSPAKGPAHPKGTLARRIHFVNCHGLDLDPDFYGEKPTERFFDALRATRLAGVAAGTVAAFECCYGAELYDQRKLAKPGIASVYLDRGAYGVLASTTIAYGPEDDNANADVICRLFLQRVLEGASLGRAFLEARLEYIGKQSVVDPYDAKTLAQFVLLGDPSIHPFRAASTAPPPKRGTLAAKAAVAARAQRRVRLFKTGVRLSDTQAYAVREKKTDAPTKRLERELKSVAGQRFKHVMAFKVRDPMGGRVATGKRGMPRSHRALIAVRRTTAKNVRLRQYEGILAYEVNGQLVTSRLVSR